jgi:hypothetical protein
MIGFDEVRVGGSFKTVGYRHVAFLAAALLLVVALAGCGGTAGEVLPETPAEPPIGPSAGPSIAPSAASSGGWELAVIYTAVEKFHTDKKVRVTGCPKLQCSEGTDDLGRHPESFVQAVKQQGSGRLTNGQYLNWSYDVGYWLDTAPRNASGGSLVSFVSAAADPTVLPQGTGFTVTGCGHVGNSKEKTPAKVCAKLSAAKWQISDQFTPGTGGDHHVDLYIGEETQKHFDNTEWSTTLNNATLKIAPTD